MSGRYVMLYSKHKHRQKVHSQIFADPNIFGVPHFQHCIQLVLLIQSRGHLQWLEVILVPSAAALGEDWTSRWAEANDYASCKPPHGHAGYRANETESIERLQRGSRRCGSCLSGLNRVCIESCIQLCNQINEELEQRSFSRSHSKRLDSDVILIRERKWANICFTTFCR